MSLMGTLAKLAIGYAAARGVDRLSGGGLLGGGAQVKGSAPTSALQAQMGDFLSGKQGQGGDQMAALSGMMAGLGGGPGNPMAEMMQKMSQGGMDLSALMGNTGAPQGGGLLSQLGVGGTGMAGMFAALASSAAKAQGQGAEAMLDAFRTQTAAPEAEAAAALMLRAMIMAAKSDGGIDAAERARILDTLGDDADAADRAFVEAQLAAPVDPAALAAEVPEAQRVQVYSASLMTIRVDTDAEAAYLDQLARAMSLDESTVNLLHMQMGLQPLYA